MDDGEIRKKDLQNMLIDCLYSKQILNNSHRGDFVEMMVLRALGKDWQYVGLGWNIWDLQRGCGKNRARIQIKHCAARQLWGKTKSMSFQFRWKDQVPNYIRRDFPDEPLEESGWFCELFVIGVHDIEDEERCNQTDPSQWKFLIVPSRELERGQRSMTLCKAIERWPLVPLTSLKSEVEAKLVEF
jgi:hypothetical protein